VIPYGVGMDPLDDESDLILLFFVHQACVNNLIYMLCYFITVLVFIAFFFYSSFGLYVRFTFLAFFAIQLVMPTHIQSG
jgi:hypothetical protein